MLSFLLNIATKRGFDTLSRNEKSFKSCFQRMKGCQRIKQKGKTILGKTILKAFIRWSFFNPLDNF